MANHDNEASSNSIGIGAVASSSSSSSSIAAVTQSSGIIFELSKWLTYSEAIDYHREILL